MLALLDNPRTANKQTRRHPEVCGWQIEYIFNGHIPCAASDVATKTFRTFKAMPPTSQNTIHHKVNFWQLPNWILRLFLLLISSHQYTCLQLLLSDWSPVTPIFLGLQILFHQMLHLINIYSEEGEKSNYSKFGKFRFRVICNTAQFCTKCWWFK